MLYLDSMILNLTERACRAFQRLTGRTNVWLALQLTNLSIILYFVWAAVFSLSSDVAPRVFIWLLCSALLYMLSQTIFKVSIESYEQDAYRRVSKGLRNPRRVRDALLRVSFLTLCVALMSGLGAMAAAVERFPALAVYVDRNLNVIVLTCVLIVLTTVVLYLLACDPLPPCVGKVRVWLKGLSPARLARDEVR